MLAVLSVYDALPDIFRSSLVIHFIDNQGVLWNTVNATSREPGCAAMAHSLALLQSRLRANVWYEYVASAANIGDLPSRGDFSYVDQLTAPTGGMWMRRRCVWFEMRIPNFDW